MFGLSKNETRVYNSIHNLALLADIVRVSKLPRSTVEYILKNLCREKFVITHKRKRRVYYEAISKKLLIEQELSGVNIFSFGAVTTYIGVRAIESLWQYIAGLPKGSRLMAIQPKKSFSQAVLKSRREIIQGVSQEITDKRFVIDALVHRDMINSVFAQYKAGEARKVARAFVGRPEDIAEVHESFLDEKSEMYLINNQIIFIDWYSEKAIRIENENIFNLLRSVYIGVKEYGTRFAQGEHIKSLLSKSK